MQPSAAARVAHTSHFYFIIIDYYYYKGHAKKRAWNLWQVGR